LTNTFLLLTDEQLRSVHRPHRPLLLYQVLQQHRPMESTVLTEYYPLYCTNVRCNKTIAFAAGEMRQKYYDR